MFDGPDASASVPLRNVTTTPTQSLLMTNGPWMLARANLLARQVFAAEQGADRPASAVERARIELVYRKLFTRRPNSAEVARARQFFTLKNFKAWLTHRLNMDVTQATV